MTITNGSVTELGGELANGDTQAPMDWEDYIPQGPLEIEKYRQLADKMQVAGVYFGYDHILEGTNLLVDRMRERVDHTHLLPDTSFLTMLDGGAPLANLFMQTLVEKTPLLETGPTFPVKMSRYGKGQEPIKIPRVLLDAPITALRGLDVVILEDLGEGWNTLRFAAGHFTDNPDEIGEKEYQKRQQNDELRGAKTVSAIALCIKNTPPPQGILHFVDYALHIPSPFGSGFGMNGNNELHRNTRAIMMSAVQKYTYFFDSEVVIEKLGDNAVLDMQGLQWLGPVQDGSKKVGLISYSRAEYLANVLRESKAKS